MITACSTRPVWRKQLTPCAAATRMAPTSTTTTSLCHNVSNVHYDHVLRVSDIAWPADEEP